MCLNNLKNLYTLNSKKTAFITGATSGIGKATAEILAKNDFKLILCGRRKDRLESLAASLSEFTSIHILTFDVRDKAAVLASIDSLPNDAPCEW